MRPGRFVGIIVAIGSIAIAAIALVYYRPPLRVATDVASVHVDVQTLGEYPTDVTKVRLMDARTDAVVWEVRSHGRAQLSTFDLNAGENRVGISHVAWGSFEVVQPRRATFEIKREQPYVLEVWGTNLPITRSRARFTLLRH
jgi:hypothetical protein